MVSSALSSFQSIGQAWRGSVTLLASDQAGQTFTATPDRYTIAERYYANAMYERADSKESAIKEWYGLPRTIRPVLSLVKPAVDWWPMTLFGGVWTADGLSSSDGQPNILPFDADTEEAVRLAIQTAYAWANGGAEIPAWARQIAMLGDGFGEIQVDYERRKAYPTFWHPKHITNIAWNDTGDVVSYTIEMPMVDGAQRYLWGKTVDKATITTLKDGKPQGYDGQPATIPNRWGFVPAVWVMFVNAGGQHGQNVVDGLYPVLDEVNGIIGSIDDFIHKFIRQTIILESPDTRGLKTKLDEQSAGKRGVTRDFANPNVDRESLGIIPAPPGTVVHRLIDNLGLGEADPHVARLLANIDRNLPELTIDEKIAAAQQVTGPGGRVIAAPMQRRVNHVFGNLASGLVRLGQMACSINGELIRSGEFGLRSQLTDAQRQFAPFDLRSFDRGDLACSLTTPQLVRDTMLERALTAAQVEKITTPWGLRYLGLSDDDIFGEGVTPETTGLLDQQREGRATANAAFGGLFNGGGTG